VNIKVLVNGVQMLVDIVIANPIRIGLVLRVALFHAVGVTIATQGKNDFHCDQYQRINLSSNH
jgi:hypothetical protein